MQYTPDDITRQSMSTELHADPYKSIRETLALARSKVYSSVNTAMPKAYWDIGRRIEEAIGNRAEHGRRLLLYNRKD